MCLLKTAPCKNSKSTDFETSRLKLNAKKGGRGEIEKGALRLLQDKCLKEKWSRCENNFRCNLGFKIWEHWETA